MEDANCQLNNEQYRIRTAIRAAAGTRVVVPVVGYPDNLLRGYFLLPDTTRVTELKKSPRICPCKYRRLLKLKVRVL